MTTREQDIIRHALDLYRKQFAIKNYREVKEVGQLTTTWVDMEQRAISEIERKLCMCGPVKRSGK